ncbi:MAG: zf-HC2 domain-containing protein [Eubacteriales bacterium]|nr:zf-HC2 domain-containing protein [Eubacteriales bacterium]
MNCQETQSNIMNYINDRLSQEETKEFLSHVRSCPDCWDELEINYILFVGMRQLDDGEVLSADFQEKLREDIEGRYLQIKREEEWQRGFRVAVFAFVFSFFLWFLGEVINYLV